jgi:hypothetical protein
MKLKKLWYTDYSCLAELFLKINSINYRGKKSETSLFSLYMHKKLTYYLFFIANTYYNLSNGQLLRHITKKIKYYKKSNKSYSHTINKLNKYTKKKIKTIEHFYCKNLNLRNYNWIKRFLIIINPQIRYFICTNSWNLSKSN